jgi:hypothetical protein
MMRTPHQISAIILAGAVLAPTVGQAAVSTPVGQVHAEVRIFDRAHKDNHVWDDREDRAYRRYMEEHHRKYVSVQRLSRARQNQYWNWRHQHPD